MVVDLRLKAPQGTESGLLACYDQDLSMRNYFISLIWIFPFLAFFLGYQILHYFSFRAIISTPNIVGHHLHDGIKILSNNHLNARILKEKEDAALPEGIIINQSPRAGQSIKAHQSVFLIVTRKPAKKLAPNFYNQNLTVVQQMAKEGGIHLNAFGINSIYPSGNVIASNVPVGTELDTPDISVYYSEGVTSVRIMPDFTKVSFADAVKLLKDYNIKYKILREPDIVVGEEAKDADNGAKVQNYKIISQSPQAGTLVDLKKDFVVEIIVQAG